MAPNYRNPNRRQNRTGVIDHDIYEGIPVRQWRRENVTVAPPPTQDNTNNQNDIWAVELPHGMPKDSHLLPQHSQDLLRAARSGRIYKRPAPVEEEEADPEIPNDKPEKKEEDPKDKGFVAKAWKAVPRHLDMTDYDFLAKKRKNLVPKKPVAPPVTLTKTTVKRIDAAGNEYVQDVVVPHGQQVEGEVISRTVIPDPNAGLLAVQPTPPKRKGGTSKKKLKGPGRGRKKKQSAPPTSVPAPAAVDGVAQSIPIENTAGSDGMKVEADTSATPTNNEDTEMGDGSMVASDDEDGDDGEDGDEGDDDEGSDVQASPAKRPRTNSPPPKDLPPFENIPSLNQPDTVMGDTEISGPTKLFTERERSESRGSPLKTVALTASALTSPQVSPTFTAPVETFAESKQQNPVEPTELASLDAVMQEEVAAGAPTTLPPPPPAPTEQNVQVAEETLREEEEEEEMLLDIVDNATNAQIGAIDPSYVEPEAEFVSAEVPLEPSRPIEAHQEEQTITESAVEGRKEEDVSNSTPVEAVEQVRPPTLEPTVPESITPEKATEDTTSSESKPAEPTATKPDPVEPPPSEPIPEDDDDDDGFDYLLGGLEKSLEKKEVRAEKTEGVNDTVKETEKAPAE